MAVKLNNISYSGFFYNGEALTAMYLNGNKVYGSGLQPVWTTSSQTISYTALPQSGLTVGKTHNLNASTTPTGGTLSYSSSNSSVATVDSNGIVTAVAEGNATITISVGAWDDNVNHIHYTSASTTVSVEVQASSQPFNPLTDSKYFVIQARSATTLTIESVSSPTGTTAYRMNGSGEWTTANVNANTVITLNQGDYLEFKGNIKHANNKYYRFKTSVAKSIDCGGWLAALEKNAEIDSSNNTVTHAFCCLFSGCTGLVNAQDLKLPNNTTTDMCRTFFGSCSNLVTAPQLPATTLASRCYLYMFNNCTSLTTAPTLPATTLADNCYGDMFHGCTSLVNPPSLPATTLAGGCYSGMFNGCKKLTTAPDLPAPRLAWFCYDSMFYNCTALTSLRVSFEQITGPNPLGNWLRNVKTTGVCYCPSNAEYSASDLGLPSNWTLSKTL